MPVIVKLRECGLKGFSIFSRHQVIDLNKV